MGILKDWLNRLGAFIHGLRSDESLYDSQLCIPDDGCERWKYCQACSCIKCPYKKDGET